MKIVFSVAVFFLSTFSQNALSQLTQSWSNDEQKVLDVVNLFFESMTKKDTATLKSIMTLEGRYYGLRAEGDSWSEHTKTHKVYIDGLSAGKSVVIERIWEPEIKVHKTIAMLWAPYDIYIDGKFLHCGVDAFSLIKTNGVWKIVGTIFTMEPEGCIQSPLGPIKDK